MRDPHIALLIIALRADLEDDSPAGHPYGEIPDPEVFSIALG
jgi:hypothetical protein